ncbi:MAG: DUF1329 domain-containing protein [bacterium]
MKKRGAGGVMVAVLQILLGVAAAQAADVSPGDVVDKENWEKVEGLIPESVLSWVKKGDFVLTISKLNYDPNEIWQEMLTRSLELNKGKYRLDEAGLIVDSATGKTPEHIVGIPFPEVDLSDPRAANMVMYDRMCYAYTLGNNFFPMTALWIGRSGFEREVQAAFLSYPLIGWDRAQKESNSDRIEKLSIVQVIAPYDIAGTNILTWRYLDDRQDMSYGFVPAIRRVRRMSPANRSDAFIGTDMCVDDAYGYDGKISAVEWAPVKRQPGIVPFLDENPQPLVQTKRGEWASTSGVKNVVYGYQKEGWQGAPWAPTNLPWVKRDVLILEFKPKDPYYNYGTQYLWIDAQVPYLVFYKVIYDRAGAYWKTVILGGLTSLQSPDKKMRFLQGGFYVAVDDRYDHATILRGLSPESIAVWFAVMDRNMFSLAGFQKICK